MVGFLSHNQIQSPFLKNNWKMMFPNVNSLRACATIKKTNPNTFTLLIWRISLEHKCVHPKLLFWFCLQCINWIRWTKMECRGQIGIVIDYRIFFIESVWKKKLISSWKIVYIFFFSCTINVLQPDLWKLFNFVAPKWRVSLYITIIWIWFLFHTFVNKKWIWKFDQSCDLTNLVR